MRKLLVSCLSLLLSHFAIGQEKYNYRYWFDVNDSQSVWGISSENEWNIDIDIRGLNDMLHTFNIQVQDSIGEWSSPISRCFIKVPQTMGVDYMTCFCYVDDKMYKQEQVDSKDGVLNWDLDVNALSQGLHNLQVSIMTPTGAMSSMYGAFFLRVPTQTELSMLKCYYIIDNEGAKQMEASIYSEGLFNFNIDVASLSDGLHKLTYMLIGENGMVTNSHSAFFYKIPVGGNGISRYEYWINETDSNKHVIELDERVNPFQLISLLPVETYPIRSSCYEFRIENKKPILYAKNELNLKVFDVSGRFVHINRKYVDENVHKDLNIDEIAVLNPNVVTQVDRPEDNEIKWFKFDAEKGLLAEIYSNTPCSIDVFTPSGELFYSVFGAEALKIVGQNLPETGIYYVAVHDPTSKKENGISLNFNLIDKFAVLEYTPDRSANTGVVDICFKGNGYDNLKSVKLENADYIINADSLIYCDNVVAKACFDFYNNNVQMSDYDIVLTFNDNGNDSVIIIQEGFKIEQAVKGEIEVTVETERIMADPYPITVKLKNTGNVGYWGIPFNIAYDNLGGFHGMDFLDFSLKFPNEKINSLAPPYVITDNLLGMGIKGLFMPLIIPYIGPNEEYVLTLGARAGGHIRFNFYAWSGTPWSEESQTYSLKARSVPVASTKVPSNLTRARYMRNVGVNTSRVHIGIAATIGSIEITSTYNRENMLEAMGAVPAGRDIDEFRMRYRGSPISPSSIAENSLPGMLGHFYSYILQMSETGNPKPTPNLIETLVPGDPNEMYGYEAESGSHYINKNVTKVHYDIEFENDPEIASAAAHTIVITDTINGRYHDLSKFSATKISLGNTILNLNGEKEFVKTVDLRPRIDVIAQVELKYDENAGIAQWIITSLDPMSMDPTIDAMQGVLPINSNGEGVGVVSYEILLKEGLDDGTEMKSRAGIVFDSEAKIMTPYWVNITDYVPPVSHIDTIECENDTIVNLRFSGEDNLSGIWRYNLYVQLGDSTEWILAKEKIEVDSCRYVVTPNINYGFCVMATDSAGNVESKNLKRDLSYISFTKGDVNDDGVIDAVDVVLSISKYLGENPTMNLLAADVVKDGIIDSQDVVGIQNLFLKSNLNLYSIKRRRIIGTFNKR